MELERFTRCSQELRFRKALVSRDFLSTASDPCRFLGVLQLQGCGTMYEAHGCMACVLPLRIGEPCYPVQVEVRLGDAAPPTIHVLAGSTRLPRVGLALVCSVSCPGSVILRTYDAIRSLRNAGIVVSGGFHSPMERDCLEFLLRGRQAVVLSPAMGIEWLQLCETEGRALDEHRLFVASVAGSDIRKATRGSALLRNNFIAALADAVFIPHAVPGGLAELTAQKVLARGQRVLTFEVEENAHLLDRGARPLKL